MFRFKFVTVVSVVLLLLVTTNSSWAIKPDGQLTGTDQYVRPEIRDAMYYGRTHILTPDGISRAEPRNGVSHGNYNRPVEGPRSSNPTGDSTDFNSNEEGKANRNEEEAERTKKKKKRNKDKDNDKPGTGTYNSSNSYILDPNIGRTFNAMAADLGHAINSFLRSPSAYPIILSVLVLACTKNPQMANYTRVSTAVLLTAIINNPNAKASATFNREAIKISQKYGVPVNEVRQQLAKQISKSINKNKSCKLKPKPNPQSKNKICKLKTMSNAPNGCYCSGASPKPLSNTEAYNFSNGGNQNDGVREILSNATSMNIGFSGFFDKNTHFLTKITYCINDAECNHANYKTVETYDCRANH